jgi:hypothetical protein
MSGRHPRSFASQSDIWTFVESSNVRKDGVKRGAPLVEIVARSPQSLTKEMQSLDFSTVRRRLVGVSDDPTAIVSDEGEGAERREEVVADVLVRVHLELEQQVDDAEDGCTRSGGRSGGSDVARRVAQSAHGAERTERQAAGGRRQAAGGRRAWALSTYCR